MWGGYQISLYKLTKTVETPQIAYIICKLNENDYIYELIYVYIHTHIHIMYVVIHVYDMYFAILHIMYLCVYTVDNNSLFF